MSRLCVKNLPKYANEDRIREFFSQKGEITDAKIIRTKDGKSRQFAFIGFRTEQEAEEALKFFNNSYMDTFRITCEVARKVGDPEIPRPWSRHSAKEEKYLNEKKGLLVEDRSPNLLKGPKADKNGTNKSKCNEKTDPQLQEFLQVTQPRTKSKIWADDTLSAGDPDKSDKANEEKSHISKGKKKKSNMENEMADKPLSIPVLQGCSETNPVEHPDESALDDDISDTDYFKSRIKKNWSDSESDVEDSNEQGLRGIKSQPGELVIKDHTFEMEEAQIHGEINDDETKLCTSSNSFDVEENENGNPTNLTSDDKDLDPGRLFIRNLPYTANEDELLELFNQFGEVSQVHLVVDKGSRRSKGYGYVHFKIPECAARALNELDNSSFQGRLLHILPAKLHISATEKLESVVGDDKKSFKGKRVEQRKASEASGDTRAWNSFLINPDTVIENISRKLGISKSDLLEREADDLPVRIALMETQVLSETKKSLSSAGVNVTALELAFRDKNIKRSNRVILVKDLTYGSSEGDLAKMFGNFGSLEKIILPPTKGLAVVIFLEAAEARAAFRGLTYKRYKDVPLKLEWAPADILSPNKKSAQDEPNNSVSEQNTKSVLLEQTLGGMLEEDIDPDRVESRSIFVKNLNFKTSNECLKKHFSDHMKNGSIKSVKVQMHLKNGKNLSMGFGFIEFDSVETATDVCKDLQGTILDGHALNLQLCHAKKDGQVQKKKDKGLSSTKLLVRNVAFEATQKDLRQLFSPFGQIKKLKLPKKFDNHRGFAFVEFVTKQEAQNALQALSSTHLYGRHLVIEQAKEGESLEELRERTAAQFVDEQSGFQKLSKKRKQAGILDDANAKFARI